MTKTKVVPILFVLKKNVRVLPLFLFKKYCEIGYTNIKPNVDKIEKDYALGVKREIIVFCEKMIQFQSFENACLLL